MAERRQAVPPRALAISIASLSIPVATVFWLPDWTSSGVGMLIWLTALIPALLLSYYRGLKGVAIAFAGGMAVITATQVSVVIFQIAEPNWALLGAIVGVYLAVSVGIAGLAEVLRRERQAAEELALIDRLTGLPNRRHLEDTLNREFAAAERGRPLTLVMFDLDHFKRVNDKHGHAAGDTTLQAFASVLQKNTRRENLSARFGGEEFVTVLSDADTESAERYSERVLAQMREWPLPWGPQTVSAGVAQYQKGMGSWEVLLGEADRALYQAKDGGRDRVCVAKQVSPPSPRAQPDAARGEATPLLAAKRAAKIYVVDDDEPVRNVLKRILSRDGHDVWDTGDPREAIRRFGDSTPDARPELIITDVIMPVMSGMRMIDEITKIEPAVKVVYMSGYVQSEIQWEVSSGAIVEFLEKPIELEQLQAAVRRLVRTPADASSP